MARHRTTDPPLVVYGVNAVAGALAQGVSIERLLVAPGRGTETILAEARRRGVRVTETDRATLERAAGTPHHQGAVATTPPYRYAELETIAAARRGVLLLDSIQDPRNLGAILRTARAAGVGGVVLPQDRSVGITSVVAATSAGCLFGLSIARVTNLVRAMETLKEARYWMVGLVPEGGRSIYELPAIELPGLVVGGEGEGLRQLVRRTCDFEATLPMAPGVESLNVSVATAIALYELCMRPTRGVKGG
jgi:23S rRNA (guanosine2251-2'-O)-methyltransferase